MKVEIKERKEQNKEDMRCKDNNLQELMKRREEALTTSMQKIDNEWRDNWLKEIELLQLNSEKNRENFYK